MTSGLTATERLVRITN